MCFVDLERTFNCVPQGVLWGVLSGLCGIGRLHQAIGPTECFCFHSQISFWWVLVSVRVAFTSDSVCDIHGQYLRMQPGRGGGPVWGLQSCVSALCKDNDFITFSTNYDFKLVVRAGSGFP